MYWVVLTTRPAPDGRAHNAYWLGPHTGPDDTGEWSLDVPRFGDQRTAARTAGQALDDQLGTWVAIPEAEAVTLT